MKTAIIIGKIDLSIFDKPKEVKSPSFGTPEEQEMYEENYRLESESEDYWDSLNDDDEDDKITFTYRLIGIKADGSDQTMDIHASCETEAEIIIESFHDGEYQLLSNNGDFDWDALEDDIPNEEELEASLYLSCQ